MEEKRENKVAELRKLRGIKIQMKEKLKDLAEKTKQISLDQNTIE